jgi:hypothetical protein
MNNITESVEYVPTPAEVDYCSRFADYSVEVDMTTSDTSRTDREKDGRTWTSMGWIQILDDVRRFRVVLLDGCTDQDREVMLGEVERIRNGYLNEHTWLECPSTRNPGVTFLRSWLIERAKEDRTHELTLVKCRTRGCTDFGGFHSVWHPEDRQDVTHHGERYERDGYAVTAYKSGAEPWMVEISAEDLTTDQVPMFVSDVQGVTTAANRLNAALAERAAAEAAQTAVVS